MSAICYVRVSTDDQAKQQYNLPTQTRKVEECCSREGLPVLMTFVDADSARTTDRPKFQEMLAYCRKNKGRVTHVVFADLSRLARNVADQSVTLTGLRKLGITPVSCDERIEDTAAGKLSVNLLGVVNQFFSDSLSERTQYRMRAGVQAGRWLWVAPVGYLNVKGALQVDPQNADLIRKAFELAATRSYTLESILHRLQLLGLKGKKGRALTKQTLSRLLRNEIYCGWVISKKNDLKVQGQHTPLISQSLFDEVQGALDGKTEDGTKVAPVVHKKVNSEFPLKGFVLCAGCGGKLTAGFVKGRSQKYPRYWCWSKNCRVRVSVGRDDLESHFMSVLGLLQPTQEFIEQLPDIAKRYWATRLEKIKIERRTLSEREAQNATLNRKIVLQKVNAEISPEDFAMLKETVAQEKAQLQDQLNALDAETRTMDALLEETQRNIVNFPKAWREGDVQTRRELCFALFPDGLYYSIETRFFEPRNTWFMSKIEEMWTKIEAGDLIGVPDGI